MTKKGLSPQAQKVFHKLYNDFPYYARSCLKIVNKKGDKQPFILNKAQLYVENKLEQQITNRGFVRALLLKGRQQGMSTYTGGRFFHKSSTRKNKKTFILSHHSMTTDLLFQMVDRYYENLPPQLQPRITTRNKREMIFGDLESSYTVGTAGAGEVGRGATVQHFHGCLSADSLIVLADGTAKPMGEMSVGDKVMTSSGAIAPVTFKTYTGDKQTYELSTWCAGEPIYLTEDHKVLTIKGYKKLKDLTVKDYIAQPGRPRTKKEKYIYNPVNTNRPQGGGSKMKEELVFEYDYDFGYFIGYYLAEGHVKKDLGQLCFAYHADETFVNNIKPILDEHATSYKEQQPKPNKKVTIVFGKALTMAVNNLVGRTEGKHIPEHFFTKPPEFLKGLLMGYLDGDGSKTQTDKIAATSVHEKIARQIARIINMLYGGCGVKRSKRERYGIPTKDVFVTRMSGDTRRRFLQIAENKDRSEKVIRKQGKTFCKVKAISARKVEPVYDIEVGHKDHNYQTTIGVVSNSEVAFWQNADKIDAGVMQSVVRAPGTEILLESTANGMTGDGLLFYEKCMLAMEGKGDYELIFIPWFWQDEYRIDPPQNFSPDDEEKELARLFNLTPAQIYWRRMKIQDFRGRKWKFMQEYPNTPLEAFQTSGERFFKTEYVVTASKNPRPNDTYAPTILMVDPSGGGKDATGIARRRGRDFYGVEEIFGDVGNKQMEIVGRIVNIIKRENIDRVFIDRGYGDGIISRLYELGHKNRVVGVSFAEQALDPTRYTNKRAEMHDLAREWLYEDGVSIPDDSKVQKHLLAVPQETHSSNGKLLIPPKEKVKENNGGESPTILDLLVLSFAYPVAQRKNNHTIQKANSPQARQIQKANSPLNTLRKKSAIIKPESNVIITDIFSGGRTNGIR